MKRIDFESLTGKIFTSVIADSDSVTFIDANGARYSLHHEQDCCESVYIDDINGDLSDLENTPILSAECPSTADEPDKEGLSDGSYTWTFFHLRTIKGDVMIKFYGSSNGYYSEDADLYELQNL